jgi:hypothetical protein
LSIEIKQEEFELVESYPPSENQKSSRNWSINKEKMEKQAIEEQPGPSGIQIKQNK